MVDEQATDAEGWMYAREWYLSFHNKARVGRFVRRRKWQRLRSFRPSQNTEEVRAIPLSSSSCRSTQMV